MIAQWEGNLRCSTCQMAMLRVKRDELMLIHCCTPSCEQYGLLFYAPTVPLVPFIAQQKAEIQ